MQREAKTEDGENVFFKMFGYNQKGVYGRPS